jgi:adenylosuccinate synthase
VLNPHAELFVGGGTVVNPMGLLKELDGLAALGIDISRVKISDRAQLVLPYHAAADRADERDRGSLALGTTGRGIGPAYVDKVARAGITFGDLSRREALEQKIRTNVAQRRGQVPEIENSSGVSDWIAEILAAADRLLSHVVDGVAYLHERLAAGKRVLIEGAQGSLLDVGYGTYPYVTSSHTIAGGACTGLGIGPTAIGRVIGVAKAYCTRVGGGPFPSELLDERGEKLRRQGAEFGTVTGRPRRCGWFDAVAGRYAVALNGLTSAVVTKLDVLTGFERLGIVTGYRSNGQSVGFSAAGAPGLEVDVEELPGWTQSLGACRRIGDLPTAARNYVKRIEEILTVPVDLVSVGRERTELAR